ncbi:MAG: DUF2059 domain-containing protein [Parasphingorhabdus sp.]|uniref:DUF2059 domain-containing protein n=1 Tax=Parasphingorhabdus sp. TaxID=2709688 RepID=UPI00329A7C1F
MKKFIAMTVSSIALTISMPAAAQEIGQDSGQDGDAATQTSAPEIATIDPARLSAAQNTVNYLFPLGTYERMMRGTMDQMMDQMMMGMGNMRMGDLAGAGGVAREDVPGEFGDKTLAELATEMDPHYEERTKISTKVIMDEMVNMMITMEPAVRSALTNIYARKFTVGQLDEMNSFFATDTGSAFARDYMMVFVDPEMMQSMMSMVPEMMQAMPAIMKKVEDATAHLPAVKISDESLIDSVEEDVNSAENGDGAIDFEDPDNWSAEDRALVNKLSTESDTAFEKYYDALEKAQSNAKAKVVKTQ